MSLIAQTLDKSEVADATVAEFAKFPKVAHTVVKSLDSDGTNFIFNKDLFLFYSTQNIS